MSNLMNVIRKGEVYLTFVFDGIDSTTMKIASVTNGSTYDTPLLPSFSDSFLDVDGYNGRYYFGTRIPSKDFVFTCFIDNLSTFEYDSIKSWLRPDKIAKLMVPETPYRYYWVKITSVGDLGNIPLTHPDNGGISYTGGFDITFSTVGQPSSYSTMYYVEDLGYFEYRDIYPDVTEAYLYDCGLLYQEETLPLHYTIDNTLKSFTLYNPGTFDTKLRIKMTTDADIANGTVEITNHTTGDMSVITLENFIPGDIIDIDYNKNIYTKNALSFDNNVVGDLIYLTGRDVVEKLEGATIYNDGANTSVKFELSKRQVRQADIGKAIMFKNNYPITTTDGGGGIIRAIDVPNNAFVLGAGELFTNPLADVIITKTDDLSIKVTGGAVNFEFSMMPRYL